MIPATHQLNPAPKQTEKRIFKEQHENRIKEIYARGADVLPPQYLTVHADTDGERVYKLKALALARRLRRNAKRLK